MPFVNEEIEKQQAKSAADMQDLLSVLEGLNGQPGCEDLTLSDVGWIRSHPNASPAEIGRYLSERNPDEASREY